MTTATKICEWCDSPLDTTDGRVKYHDCCAKAKRTQYHYELAQRNIEKRRAYNREWMRRWRNGAA